MNFDAMDFSLSYGNFDPADIQVDETINAVFVVDVSPSIASYVAELNLAFEDFVQQMQQSHVAEQLLVSVIEFNNLVIPKSGFQPIRSLPKQSFAPYGGGTALYDAVKQGLDLAVDYRQNLMNSGVSTKTLLFVITDGEDNSSRLTAKEVKKSLQQVLANEANAYSFVSILFGVGSAANFTRAQQDMGIQQLAQVGTSGQDIKKMLGIISQSISRTAANQSFSF